MYIGRTSGQKKTRRNGTEEKRSRNEQLVQSLTTKLKDMDDDMMEKETARREEEESRRKWEEQDSKRMTFMKDLMQGFFEAMKK